MHLPLPLELRDMIRDLVLAILPMSWLIVNNCFKAQCARTPKAMVGLFNSTKHNTQMIEQYMMFRIMPAGWIAIKSKIVLDHGHPVTCVAFPLDGRYLTWREMLAQMKTNFDASPGKGAISYGHIYEDYLPEYYFDGPTTYTGDWFSACTVDTLQTTLIELCRHATDDFYLYSCSK